MQALKDSAGRFQEIRGREGPLRIPSRLVEWEEGSCGLLKGGQGSGVCEGTPARKQSRKGAASWNCKGGSGVVCGPCVVNQSATG